MRRLWLLWRLGRSLRALVTIGAMSRLPAVPVHPEDAPLWMAMEMATIGIVPAAQLKAVGFRFLMAGQEFIVTGHASREEFVAAAATVVAPEDVAAFCTIPAGMYFLRISTD